MTKNVFEELTWPAIEERTRRCDIAVLPFGSMEPQPAHLPVGTDTYIIEGLVRRGVERVTDDVGALVLPAFDFGNPAGPTVVPDAMNLPWDVLLDLLTSILSDLYRQGFRRFVLVNGHGKTGVLRLVEPTIDDQSQMAGEGFSYQTAFGFAYDAAAQFVETGPNAEIFFVTVGGFLRDTSAVQDGELTTAAKTSLLLSLHPELVDLSQPVLETSLTCRYPFAANPRYGVGFAMADDHYNKYQTEIPPEAITAKIGEDIIQLWSKKFADILLDMQAKSHLVGRYRSDAYKSDQP